MIGQRSVTTEGLVFYYYPTSHTTTPHTTRTTIKNVVEHKMSTPQDKYHGRCTPRDIYEFRLNKFVFF